MKNKNILTILFLMLVLTVISCGNSNKKSDLVKLINDVIDENTKNGNFEKWVDEYSKVAVEKAK